METKPFTNPTALPPAPSGWQITAIEDLCLKVTSGGTPLRSVDRFYREGTHSWFKTQELRDCVLLDSAEKITDEALIESSAKLFPRDTVLMAMYGDGKTITGLGILAAEAATNQACCAMIPNDRFCNSRFLFYALMNHRLDFIRIATGGAQRNLSGKLIRRFAINTPPLSEQRAIAYTLGTLDEKIEQIRRIGQTLDGIARALFKSWFVDFDPIRANAHHRDLGPSNSVANLFPDSFEESELGKIPKGWAAVELDSLLTSSKSRIGQEEAPEYSATVTGLMLRDRQFNKQLSKSREKNKRIESGDLVFGLSRRVLNFGLMREEVGSVSPVYEIFRVDRQKCIPELLESLIRVNMHAFLDILKPAAREGQSVDRLHLLKKRVALPSKNVQERLYAALDLYRRRANSLQSESATLSKIRDTLLPKLISGELRIPHTERILGGQEV